MKIKSILWAAATAATLLGSTYMGKAQTKEKTVMVGGAPMYPSKNIIENAVNSKDHTTLVAAVKAAGLVETLQELVLLLFWLLPITLLLKYPKRP